MAAAPARQTEEGALPPAYVELERVLSDEARALKALDRAGIDRAAERKTELLAALAAAHGEVKPEHRGALERIRKLALRNHMLLAHARDSVRQVLSTASGRTGSGRPSSPLLGGLRLDVRG
jgi:flagellar biosynthesis/type III secretory pathway chaperone